MKKSELIDLVKEFYQKFLKKKPPINKMEEEVKLMGLRIRPLTGDIARLATLKTDKFIEVVWFVGKLDEFLRSGGRKLSPKDIEKLLYAITQVYASEFLKGLNVEEVKQLGLEVEIMKKIPLKSKLN